MAGIIVQEFMESARVTSRLNLFYQKESRVVCMRAIKSQEMLLMKFGNPLVMDKFALQSQLSEGISLECHQMYTKCRIEGQRPRFEDKQNNSQYHFVSSVFMKKKKFDFVTAYLNSYKQLTKEKNRILRNNFWSLPFS